MESISLVEHESLPILDKRSRGQKALATRHATLLARLESRLPAQTFSWRQRSVKFAHYCGVISLGDLSLEILPKIHGRENEPGACRSALIRMLTKARLLKTRRGGAADIALQRHSLLDVFLLHFCDQLQAELTQGMIRHYVERNANLHVLRGRLQVEQQLKHNLAHRERLYCRYDELSVDNCHNQVIRYVLRAMTRLSGGIAVRKRLNELLFRFEAVRDVPVTTETLENLYFDRSTSRYRDIFRQCHWFLQGLHPDVVTGHASCATLLFDMNRLFEAYAANIFRALARAEGLRLRTQGPRKYMVWREDRDEQVFLMKPDMVFFDHKSRIVSIADAKWKLLDDREKKLGISQADLYQMAGYAMRYGTDRLAMIYPRQQHLQHPTTFHLQGSDARITIIPLDVTVRPHLSTPISHWTGRV